MTLTKRVIPCLDVAKGSVVKGLNFKSIKDAGDPVLLAEKYSNEGADELVFLDITASEENREIIKSLVTKVAKVFLFFSLIYFFGSFINQIFAIELFLLECLQCYQFDYQVMKIISWLKNFLVFLVF